jgi:hypothetical protein
MPYKDEEKKKEYQKKYYDNLKEGFKTQNEGLKTQKEPIPEKPEWWDDFTNQTTSEAVPKYKREKRPAKITEIFDERDRKAFEEFQHEAWKKIQEEHDWWEDKEKNIEKMREERIKHPRKEDFIRAGELSLIKKWVMKGKLANIEPALREQLLRGFPDGIPEEVKAVLPEDISPQDAAVGILKEIEAEPVNAEPVQREDIRLSDTIVATNHPDTRNLITDWYEANGWGGGFNEVRRSIYS